MAETVTLPGFVDMHVHYRQPGYEDAEDYYTGTAAAIRDGVILSADMPNNPGHPTNTPKAARTKIGLIQSYAVGDVALYARYEPDWRTELKIADPEVRQKMYTEFDWLGIARAKAYADFTQGNARKLGAGAFEEEVSMGLAANPDWLSAVHVEGYSATNEMLSMVAGDKGGRIHIAHARRPELEAFIDFLQEHPELEDLVSAEVCAQHLFMHDGYTKKLGWLAMMKPIMTPQEDAEWLRQKEHLKYVKAFATDHAPHPVMSKFRAQVDNPEMNTDPNSGKKTCFGFASAEVARMVFLQLVQDGTLTLDEYVDKVSKKPAEILRIEPREAQVVVDMTPRRLSPNDPVYSKCGTNPLAEAGVMAGGTVKEVIVEGKTVFADGKVLAQPGDGKYLPSTLAA